MDCSTLHLCSADSPGPFLFTPNSLLLENTLITDLQQITGNGQQSITCGGGQGIFRDEVIDQLADVESISQQHLRANGPYFCLGQSMKRIYFNIFTNNFSESITHTGDAKVYCTCVLKVKHIHLSTAALPTPIIHASAGKWTFTSPDVSQVKRYIIEFECSVRNMTFVEKYTSVSANRGRSGVARNVLCFGELGQLCKVIVWAVSGHNISQQPAVRCLTADRQCSKGRMHTWTCF